ncbi:MAG: hypothetical protein CMA89_00470 [Euryarchaeota archaeon]|nr:hypothetical protein [Euryarchaeota archaeon]
MSDGGTGKGLPQMSDSDVMSRLLSENLDRDQSEPEVASSIGEQMLHMDIPLLPRSVRARIRDVCSRIEPRNATLVGGGIGHLSAWLFDLWSNSGQEEKEGPKHPVAFRIIEPGTRFCVIIDRLIRRYEAEGWAQSVSMPWQEVFAETSSSIASNVAIPENALNSILPMPLDLFIIDLPEGERVAAASAAFEMVSPGGLVLLLEPTVPTGDVGDFSEGEEPTPAQLKVQSFNDWIELVKRINASDSVGFTDLTGGTLVAFLKSF